MGSCDTTGGLQLSSSCRFLASGAGDGEVRLGGDVSALFLGVPGESGGAAIGDWPLHLSEVFPEVKLSLGGEDLRRNISCLSAGE